MASCRRRRRGMGKDEGDHGDAEVASVVEHEGVAARFNHAGIVMAPGTDGVGDDIAKTMNIARQAMMRRLLSGNSVV